MLWRLEKLQLDIFGPYAKRFGHPSVLSPPGDELLLLDVGQELRVVLAGQVQTLSMQAQDLQAVQHVKQDVRLLKLGHFLTTQQQSMTNNQNA